MPQPASSSRRAGPCRRVVVCHHGHENDACCTENIFEFLSERGIGHDFIDLRGASATEALRRCLAHGPETSLLGFNSQIDHGWVADEPLITAAARHGVPVVQWILDHPSVRWPEFNYSTARTSRFLFHSPFSQAYFARYCCADALTATAGSIGPHQRSRSTEQNLEAFSRRPIACLIALGLARVHTSAAETADAFASLPSPLRENLGDAVARARFDLEGPLEAHVAHAIAASGFAVGNSDFNRYFRLLNDLVQGFRRAQIFQVASRFGVLIQSDETARAIVGSGFATFRSGVSMRETLASMPQCRAVLSISPVNDSIHDRTCNALNAGCLPILEDNRAHRALFSHGENALLFRYHDDSLAECLAITCASPKRAYVLAQRAAVMRDQPPFRFGAFQNIVELAGPPVSLSD
jgi:hypothetical protein